MVVAIIPGALLLPYPGPDLDHSEILDRVRWDAYVNGRLDIEMANPNLHVDSGRAFWKTTHISAVADQVKYTMRGTILEVRDPVAWYTRDSITAGYAAVPVVMSVETVYKGSFDSDTITLFLGAFLDYTNVVVLDAADNPELAACSAYCGNYITIANAAGSTTKHLVFPFEPQFEVGDHVLVHIHEVDMEFFDDKILSPQDRDLIAPHYTVQLGEHGAYRVHEGRIYNDSIPHGLPITRAIGESRTIGDSQ